MRIPNLDLKAQYNSIKDEIHSAINNVLEDTAFVGGKYVRDFEKEFAQYCQAKYAVGAGNGTEALFLALKAYDIGAGDEVITVPYTFIATTEAITLTGATVKFVDVDEDSFTMDVSQLAAAITPRTKAIIPVHLYGQPVDMDPVMEIARQHNLKVIEDAAQAHGAEYHGRRVGSLADIGCFSFYPGKNLGAYGDGGGVVTDDEDAARKMSMWADHGSAKKYVHDFEGFNFRLDGIQAAILSVKLKHLDKWTDMRRNNAGIYNKLLSGVNGLVLPREMADTRHVYHLYVIRCQDRDRLQQKLQDEGISTGIHYPVPLHLQPAYKYLNLNMGSYPVSEKISSEILSLPMYPELTGEQIERVAKVVAGFAEKSQ